MFQREEKKAIIKIILFFFFLDLSYLGKNAEAGIEALWLIFSLIFGLILVQGAPILVIIGIIPLVLLIKKRENRLFKYIKEYETAPCIKE